ncbi:hypothetical protein [Glycomyces paridis]|uniref:Uncharacterized protein n=1 Tax=Glycomyces paridis TaxID=2126555 RepID=A0A4S8PA33_9ACTN|nr:hypothetical protein [Glycomyces paridis]THV26012.1 hypothetical protein E9998_19975 [Glycomyces paridis]
MTLALTYLDDLSRVRIEGTSLAEGTITVERSLNGLLWETVRGGAAVEIGPGGTFQLDDYEFAPGLESTYRIRGAVEETLSAPSADQVFGDPWIVPAGIRTLTGRITGAGGDSLVSGTLACTGAGGGAWCESEHDVTPGETLHIIVGQATYAGTVHGRYSALIRDSTILQLAPGGSGVTIANTPGAGGVATAPAIGDDVHAGGAGAARQSSTTAGGGGGSSASPAGNGVAGSAGASGIGGAGGVAPTGGGNGGAGGNTGASGLNGVTPGGGGGGRGGGSAVPVAGLGAHGEVVLLSWPFGTAEDATITPVVTRVWLCNIRYPLLNRTVSVGDVSSDSRAARGGTFEIKGRSVPVVVSDLRSSPSFTLTLRTGTLAEARDLDLSLAVGNEFYLQVPPDGQVPGGYVAIGNTTMNRFGSVSTRRRWDLPCRIAAAPAPEVLPATLTWATVLATYGSWQAVLAANPTWADLLATVGSPEDLVVL